MDALRNLRPTSSLALSLLLCAALAACTPPKRAPTLEDEVAARIESPAPRPRVTIEPEVAAPSRSVQARPARPAFVEAPRPLLRPAPRYPGALEGEALSGRVVVRFEVDVDGQVQAVEVRRSSHKLFADAVHAALAQWRFAPARAASGEAVPAQLVQAFDFRMGD